VLLKQMRQRRADDDTERAESGAARRALRARRDREHAAEHRSRARRVAEHATRVRRHIATTPRSMGERGDDGARDGAEPSSSSSSPSFALVLLPSGFVVRPVPPWPDARRTSRLAHAQRALDALTHQYDRAWREIASDVLHRGVMPANGALSALPIVYVDGGCACEVWDYRGGAANAVADVRTVRLRATSATIARDAEIEANAMEALEDEDAATMRRLRLEGALLAATKPALRLESPSREDAS